MRLVTRDSRSEWALALLVGACFALVSGVSGGTSARAVEEFNASVARLNAAVLAGPGAGVYGYATRVAVMTQGASLGFSNLDQAPHTLTSVALGDDGEPLFTASDPPGSKRETVLGASKLAPGTYNFYCQFHPNMTGQLIVQGSGGGVRPSAPKFEQPLRIPREVTGSTITIPVVQSDVQILAHGEPTAMYTYGGTYPGPTIRRPAGADTKINFVNKLPEATGEITVHLHGGHQAAQSDGQPDSQLIAPGHSKTYDYPLIEEGKPVPSAFEFYHDHRMGLTGRNVWNGLQGMVIIDDPSELKLGLPSGRFDVPLLVSDRSINRSHQLTEPFPYPGDGSDNLTNRLAGPYSPPGDATVGSRILVNGQFEPYFNVSARRYRLRLLNASGFQSYNFHLSDATPMAQISTGSGLLERPVLRNDILLGPAERADVIVDFGQSAGKRVLLQSIARTDNSVGGIGTPEASLMEFRVATRSSDPSRLPERLSTLEPLQTSRTPTMTWTFSLGVAGQSGTYWAVNGRRFDPTRVDATIPLGSTQTWLLQNYSPITHYIHLHEMRWRTVQRDGLPPPAWEVGLKDTWRLDPGESVMVAAKFTDYTGSFMIHCHMLDHEDHGMMAQFEVVKQGGAFKRLPPALGTPGRSDAAFVAGLDDLLPPIADAAMAAMPGLNHPELTHGVQSWPRAWWCRPAFADLRFPSLRVPRSEHP